MKATGAFGAQGSLSMKVIRAKGPGLRWHLANRLRWVFLWGCLTASLAKLFSKFTGVPTITSQLAVRVIKADGRVIDYGVVGRRVVTDAGVAFLVDAWQGIVEPEIMRYHALGTDDTPGEAVGDTGLQLELTNHYTPDNTRATGTLAEGATANIFRSVGTNTISDAIAAVVEHGLISQAATGGGTLWDRTTFAVINLAIGDSLQSTYEATLNSGG